MSNEIVDSSLGEMALKRLTQLKIVLDPDIHYRLESVFPKLTGWWSSSEIKRQGKLIRAAEPTLKKILLDGEEVLYVAKGIQYSLAENYFMGAIWAQMLNRTVFVLTNARLLLMRCNGSGKPNEMFWMIYYSEIKDFKATWTGMLKLKLSDNNKFTFTGFPSLDRKSMPKIFQTAMNDYRRLNLSPSATQSRETLCCHCFNVVPKGEFVCSHCDSEYWKPRDLALRSLIFPSWGDICMKHYGLAFFELLGYLFSWIVALASLTANDLQTGLVKLGIIFLLEHPFDAVLTYRLASKGLYYRRKATPMHTVSTVEIDEFGQHKEAADF